jgi:hypothetical protein
MVLLEVVAHRAVAWEGVDGLGEVGVGGAVTGEDAGDAGQDVMEVESVGVEEGRGWESEVEDEEVSVWAEDAMHFAEGVGPGAHVAEAEGDGEGVEGVVGEGEVEGVCDDGILKSFASGLFEHGFAEVGTGDVGGWEGGLDGEGEIAGAGGEIEDVLGGALGDALCGEFSPGAVDAEAEEAVDEVVPFCDAAEEGVNAVGGDGAVYGHLISFS